jgi:hypothetical protein
MPGMPSLWRLRQAGEEFKVTLDNILSQKKSVGKKVDIRVPFKDINKIIIFLFF